MVLALAVVVAASAQISSEAHSQGTSVGPYKKYAVWVCNGSSQPGSIEGGLIWKQIAHISPVLTSEVLLEQRNLQVTSKKKKILYGIGIASGFVTVFSGAQAIKVDPSTTGGKLYYGVLGGLTIGLPLVATQIDNAPERQVVVDTENILRGRIVLAPNECQLFTQYGMK